MFYFILLLYLHNLRIERRTCRPTGGWIVKKNRYLDKEMNVSQLVGKKTYGFHKMDVIRSKRFQMS